MERVSNTNLYVSSTPYHIIVSCAFMNDGDYLIIEDNNTIDDYILNEFAIKKFKNNIVHVDYYRNLFGKDIFKAKRNFKKIKNILSTVDIDSIYIFNDAEPYGQYLFKHYKNSNRCILEEGIGLYNDMYHRQWIKKIVYGKLFFGLWYSIVTRIGEYKYSDYIFAKEDKLLTNKQLSKKIIIEDYKKVDELLKKSNIKIRRKIWFISQPLVEDEICDKNSFDNFFSSFVKIAYDNGIKISLKPHPREDIRKYSKYSNIEIIDKKNIPFELLLDTSEKVILFTISSSAVYKFSEIDNVNIYFLHRLIDTKIDYSNISCDKNKKDVLQSFKELKTIIEDIKDE